MLLPPPPPHVVSRSTADAQGCTPGAPSHAGHIPPRRCVRCAGPGASFGEQRSCTRTPRSWAPVWPPLGPGCRGIRCSRGHFCVGGGFMKSGKAEITLGSWPTHRLHFWGPAAGKATHTPETVCGRTAGIPHCPARPQCWPW